MITTTDEIERERKQRECTGTKVLIGNAWVCPDCGHETPVRPPASRSKYQHGSAAELRARLATLTAEVERLESMLDDVHVVQFTAYDATNGTHPILAIPFEDFDTATLVETTEATGE